MTPQSGPATPATDPAGPGLNPALPHSWPPRQWLLNFHQPPKARGLGAHLDAPRLARDLRASGVGLVHLFAKCHYGLNSYEGRCGRRHPGLRRDLLRETARACKAEGMGVLAYVSVVRDHRLGEMRPEWRCIQADGTPQLGYGKWWHLCLNGGYSEESFFPQLRELASFPELDGLWLDGPVLAPGGCLCPACRKAFRRANGRRLDPSDLRAPSVAYEAFVRQSERSWWARAFAEVESVRRGLWMGPLGFRQLVGRDPAWKTFTEAEVWPRTVVRDHWAPLLLGRVARRCGLPYQAMATADSQGWYGHGVQADATLDLMGRLAAITRSTAVFGHEWHPSGRVSRTVLRAGRRFFRSFDSARSGAVDDGAPRPIGIAINLALETALLPHQAGLAEILDMACLEADLADGQSGPARWDEHRSWIVPGHVRLSSEWVQALRTSIRGGATVLVVAGPHAPGLLKAALASKVTLDAPEWPMVYAPPRTLGDPGRDLPWGVQGRPMFGAPRGARVLWQAWGLRIEGDPEAYAEERAIPWDETVRRPLLWTRRVGRGCLAFLGVDVFSAWWLYQQDAPLRLGLACLERIFGRLRNFEVAPELPLRKLRVSFPGGWRLHLVVEPWRRAGHRQAPPPAACFFPSLRGVRVRLRAGPGARVVLPPGGRVLRGLPPPRRGWREVCLRDLKEHAVLTIMKRRP